MSSRLKPSITNQHLLTTSALLVALLSTSLSSARADDFAELTSAEEVQAESSQAEFDSLYELTDENGDELSTDAGGDENSSPEVLAPLPGEPNWYKLLRPSVTTRARRGKPSRTYTPKVQYGVMFTGPSQYSEGANDQIAPASISKIFTSSLALKELGGDFTYKTRFTWRKSTKAGDGGYLRITGSADPSITSASVSKVAEEFVQALVASGVKRVYGELKIDATDARWNRRVIPAGWKESDGTGDIPGPLSTVSAARMKAVLKARLAKHAINWASTASVPFAEHDGILSEENHVSKPLRELIQPFMFRSINYMGEAFLRKIGEMKGSKAAPDLLSAGLPLLREFVAANIGTNKVTLNDGCGLSRTSRVTATAVVAFLTEMRQEPYFRALFASLPTAGSSGTLAGRMRGTAAAGRIHAKTGTLYTPNGNFQLAGYLVENTKAGPEYHPFTILTVADGRNDGYCRSTQDRVLAKLASWMASQK